MSIHHLLHIVLLAHRYVSPVVLGLYFALIANLDISWVCSVTAFNVLCLAKLVMLARVYLAMIITSYLVLLVWHAQTTVQLAAAQQFVPAAQLLLILTRQINVFHALVDA